MYVVVLMRQRPPIATRTDTRCPYTTLFQSIVEARRQHIGADHDAALDLGPEAFGARRGVHVLQPRALRQVAKPVAHAVIAREVRRSEEHTSELQSLMRISYAVFCLKKQNTKITH